MSRNLKFHEIHGKDIMLYHNMTTARRLQTNDSGLTFTSQCVKPTQKVHFKLVDVSNERVGIISIGFTSYDPTNLQYDLPKCLKHKPGFWICSLSKQTCTKGKTIFFYVSPSGGIHYGVDGEEKGHFDKKIDTGRPLWGVIDIWSKSTTIHLTKEKRNDYKFTPKPLQINERVNIKLLSSGRIALGVTSFNPSFDTTILPQDPDLLLDRPEYWVLVDDPTWNFARDDEISFTIGEKGEMKIWKNDVLLLKVVHVDHTLHLWGFVKLDTVEKIEMTTSLVQTMVPPVPNQEPSNCLICCEKGTEAALYPCGHTCMCYECATQWRGNRERSCLICRAPVKDVIKIYK
ncbi:protein neuralized-like isoform X2 [Tribolium madens]|uniref:protein neuralized-like isoform X2 n=1 Tax=Tribolium madens TaxID=41895 RepID=UPI001CF72F86|nr:protein neuralized-like isoform X2 [Tribolium madens]